MKWGKFKCKWEKKKQINKKEKNNNMMKKKLNNNKFKKISCMKIKLLKRILKY